MKNWVKKWHRYPVLAVEVMRDFRKLEENGVQPWAHITDYLIFAIDTLSSKEYNVA